jgi:hypothetical protein
VNEPVIQLPAGTRHSRPVVDHCRWTILTFVAHDAYVAYDYAGGTLGPPSSSITGQQVLAINVAMRARSSRTAWGEFIGTVLPELTDVPPSLDLVDGAASAVLPAAAALARLAGRIGRARAMTDMAASKVLYLLRPRFAAISDSYVRACLGLPEAPVPDAGTRDRELFCQQRMRSVLRAIRQVGLLNRVALDELHAYANSLPPVVPSLGPFKGTSVPVRLSKVRVLDILLWADVALYGPNPSPDWRRWREGLPTA